MSEKEIKIDKIESKKQRIGELIAKREEYVNNGETDKEIEVLRELRILFKSVFGVESEENKSFNGVRKFLEIYREI